MAECGVYAAMTDGNIPRNGLRLSGAVVVYRLADAGYAIDLARAQALLAAKAPERGRPVQGEAQALQIRNPPLTVLLATEPLAIDGTDHPAEVSARIFDFGVVSLRVRVATPPASDWDAYTRFGRAVDQHPALGELMTRHLTQLVTRLAPAIERPLLADVREDYTVFRVTSLTDTAGEPLSAAALADRDLVPLLLGETRAISAEARRALLPHRFRYADDDLAVLTWERALVVAPGVADPALQYVMEFANAQLLELRYYDAMLDAELPRLYDAIAAARQQVLRFPGRRFAAVLARVHTVVADTTEVVEQVENALKVTDDVYLARVYAAALALFRGRDWRAGIDRKLAILRDTYAMLNDEAQAARSEWLEMAIIVLIVAEILLAFLHR